jgi:hypothetical protein
MLVKPLLYCLNSFRQVLNRLMLKDIFDNVLAGQAFEPVVPINHPIYRHQTCQNTSFFLLTAIDKRL